MNTVAITHPVSKHLTDFVAGQLDRYMRVLIETHLAFCATCRHTVTELSRPGSLRLAATAPVPLPASSWARLSRRLDSLDEMDSYPLPSAALAELEDRSQPPEIASGTLTRPTGRPLHWRRLPFSTAQIMILDRAKGIRATESHPEGLALILGRADSGQIFPRHRHLDVENVVVLEGGYRDQYGHWTAGSWAEYPAGSEHAPLAEPGGSCVVLARLSGGSRFTGLCGLALALRRVGTRLRRSPHCRL